MPHYFGHYVDGMPHYFGHYVDGMPHYFGHYVDGIPHICLRFMESEVDLHDAIEELHTLSVAPQLYQCLMALNLPHNLMALIGHDNTDIAAAVLDLLQVGGNLDYKHKNQSSNE